MATQVAGSRPDFRHEYVRCLGPIRGQPQRQAQPLGPVVRMTPEEAPGPVKLLG